MPAQKLRDFLDENGVKYVSIAHSRAYTALEVAASAHISGKEVAKTVIVKLDGRSVMCVTPAHEQVDLDLLRAAAGAREAQLASEPEFAEIFPDCELGAMPPFGNLYDMDVFVARHLAEDEQIAFNAGSHTELFQLAYEDFARLAKPIMVG